MNFRLLCGILFFESGCLMCAAAQPSDPEFVSNLKKDISGIFFPAADKYSDKQIEDEFRKAVEDRGLLRDEQFVDNLMFLVRKKEVCALRADVERVSSDAALKARAEVSALKTWYACGDQADRDKIDNRLVARLKQQKQRFDELETTPALKWADRIGGPKTMELLKQWHKEVAQKQQEAETQTPDEHMHIGRLDKMRSSLDTKIFDMSRRIGVAGQGEVDRASAMAELYLGRAGMLGYWAYKELVRQPTPGAVQGVRRFVSQKLSTLVPAEGVSQDERSEMLKNNRLRGLCLLQAMGEQLNRTEQAFFDQHAEEVEERKAYFRPDYDWEDVLDRL